MSAFREKEYYDKPKYNQFKNYNSKPIIIKKEFLLKENEFPDLALPVNINININNNTSVKSFASLLKKDEEISETSDIDEVDEIIPPGWSYYKYTRFKNGLCGDKNSEVTTKIQKPFINIITKFEIVRQKLVLNEAEEVFNALSLLHQKRTNEYKELWGESEWERMFLCPNHDYEYFDKLDAVYEAELAKINEQYCNDIYEDSDNY